MVEFRIEIAEVPVLIRCHDEKNAAFFREYLTEKRERFIIEPGPEDLAGMQRHFDRMDEVEGRPGRQRSDSFLENNAIHKLLAERLVFENVILMHGSALCMDGQAFIFTAASGTGKSTHARLWREVFGDRVWMINDDKPMLRIEENGVQVYGTPWNGKHHLGRNACAPLKAIAQLRRDTSNHIEPLSKADAFAELIRRGYVSDKPAVMAKITALDKSLLDLVPFYRLDCNIEEEAAMTAWQGMSI